ncbi:hypothetical protein J6590_001065 [Homalodisca vitripennis]|nr:hypothetical protein J6590_001065 [Homalodisca vitripennis]
MARVISDQYFLALRAHGLSREISHAIIPPSVRCYFTLLAEREKTFIEIRKESIELMTRHSYADDTIIAECCSEQCIKNEVNCCKAVDNHESVHVVKSLWEKFADVLDLLLSKKRQQF